MQTCCGELQARVDNGLLPGGLSGTCRYLGQRFARRGVTRLGDANQTTCFCLGLTVLSSTLLAVLLIIGGIEQNPGPVVKMVNTVQL